MINHHSSNQRRQNDMYLLEKNAYLLCLHVKPTSLFCGLIILIMSFMNIVILLSRFTIEFNPSLERNASNFTNNNFSPIDPRLKTNKLIILYIIAESLKLLISSLLIYGITRCKPSYLIPFFLMQLFYFFRSISFFLEHYANYQQSTVYRTDEYVSFQKNRTEIPQSYPMFIFFFSLLYKFYFITCVWKCYKYLKIKEATIQLNQNYQFRQHHQHQSVNAISALHQQTNPPSYNDVTSKDDRDYIDQKLPSYDEAIKIILPDPEKNESTNLVPTHLQNSASITISTTNESNKLSQKNGDTQV